MAGDEDFEQHRRTWSGFVRLLTYSSLSAVAVLGFMAIFLL